MLQGCFAGGCFIKRARACVCVCASVVRVRGLEVSTLAEGPCIIALLFTYVYCCIDVICSLYEGGNTEKGMEHMAGTRSGPREHFRSSAWGRHDSELLAVPCPWVSPGGAGRAVSSPCQVEGVGQQGRGAGLEWGGGAGLQVAI